MTYAMAAKGLLPHLSLDKQPAQRAIVMAIRHIIGVALDDADPFPGIYSHSAYANDPSQPRSSRVSKVRCVRYIRPKDLATVPPRLLELYWRLLRPPATPSKQARVQKRPTSN